MVTANSQTKKGQAKDKSCVAVQHEFHILALRETLRSEGWTLLTGQKPMILHKESLWLVVEDDDDDFLLFCSACSRALTPQPVIHRAKDVKAAKDFLAENPEAYPNLIVSDLRMPLMNGLELLEWVRRQASLKRVRFVLLSDSDADQDVQTAEKLGADEYRMKPSLFGHYIPLVKEIEQGTHPPEGSSSGTTR